MKNKFVHLMAAVCLAVLGFGTAWATEYTVTFKLNYGDDETYETMETDEGKLDALPTSPVRISLNHWTFDGWYPDTEGEGEKILKNSTEFTEDVTVYAKWTLNTYTITFNANGGSVAPTTGTTGDGWKLASLPTPTRTGYSFAEWNRNSDGTGSVVTDTSVFLVNTTIHAKWTLNTYTITFNANGGSVTPTFGTTGDGWKLASLPTPTRTGYTFAGWNLTEEDAGTSVTTAYVYSGNTTIYARWTLDTYIVTFNPNSGSVTPTSGTTGAGWTLASLPTPTRAGYTFAGWNLTAEGTGTPVTTTYVYSAATTIYARWNPVPYTVTFDLANGSGVVPDPINTFYDARIPLTQKPNPANFTKSGFVNDGKWYTATKGANATTNLFQENFEAGENGWTLVNGTQPNRWVIGNATYYAGSYSAYISNDGSSYSSNNATGSWVHLYKDFTFPESEDDFKLEFYFKGGWDSEDGYMAVKHTPTTTAINAGQTFPGTLLNEYYSTTTWTKQYNISLSSATFSGQTRRIVFSWKNNPSISTESPAAIDNVIITGSFPSYTYPSGSEFVFGESGTVINGDKVLYLKWVPQYTVRFDANGGTLTAGTEYGYTDAAGTVASPTPTRTGYTFLGWYSATTGGTLLPASGIAANATYYARWQIAEYTITFNTNDNEESPANQTTYTYYTNTTELNAGKITSITTLPAPTRTGYTFVGWYPNQDGTGEQITISKVYSANTTVYAKWTPILYTISFNTDGGGTAPDAITADRDTRLPALTATDPYYPGNFTKAGYLNDGKWYTRTAGSSTTNTTIFNETFENGINDWVLVNGSQTNYWMRGTATSYAGSYSAYITNNGSANQYTISSATSTVHLYRDIVFPESSSNFTLTFYFKGYGESSYDDMSVRYTTTTTAPTAGSVFSSGTLLGTYYGNTAWTQKTITLPYANFSGKTMRLVFSWRNDGSDGTNPPAAIDNIVITGAVPSYDYTEFVFGETGTLVKGNTTLYLKWSPTYTVTFNVNGSGGTVTPASGTTNASGTLSSLPTPTRPGYAFAGWFSTSAATGGTEYTASSTFSAATTIYARWTLISYPITYDLNGGILANSNPTSYNIESAAITLNNPTRTGYTFAGWTGSNGEIAQTTVTIPTGSTGNKGYTANWTPLAATISFNLNGGEGGAVPAPISTVYDAVLTLLQKPSTAGIVKTGYCNDGNWYTRSALSSEVYTEFVFGELGTPVKGTTELLIKWDKQHRISFNSNGGSVSPSFDLTCAGERLDSLPTPTRIGYIFDGWYTAATGGTLVDLTTVFKSDTTIYAYWSKGTPIISQITAGNRITQTRNGMNLATNTNAIVEIYGLNGKLISRQSYIAGNHSISLGHLPKGLYMVEVRFAVADAYPKTAENLRLVIH